MKKILLILFLSFSVGCALFDAPAEEEDPGPEGEDTETAASGARSKNDSNTLALALGGVGAGMDEINIAGNLNGEAVGFEAADPSLFGFDFITGTSSFTEGAGGRVIPKKVGIGTVWPTIAGQFGTIYTITTSPQSLIQILIGEARGQLTREAAMLDEETINLNSVSPTGDAVGAVIRNRIDLIEDQGSPGLFAANRTLFYSDQPESSYDAVIEGNANGVYQFSPVDPTDPTHEKYLAAAVRDTLVDFEEDLLTPYDQAVLTAADVFNRSLTDPTKGAFGFYSPSASQYDKIQQAFLNQATVLPSGVGTSDAQYPAFKPIQILILPAVATTSSDSDVPSFVFVRGRNSGDPAVTNVP
ncbi:MAG: hypothetical protein Q7S00_02245 [bacterium]|nr:hypothetical protein [bacterium]